MTLSEYESRALREALDRVSQSSLRWLPDYLDRMERLVDDYRLLVERHEAALAASPAEPEPGIDVEVLWSVLESIGHIENGTWVSFQRKDAARIAAEYARLSEPAQRETPEGAVE